MISKQVRKDGHLLGRLEHDDARWWWVPNRPRSDRPTPTRHGHRLERVALQAPPQRPGDEVVLGYPDEWPLGWSERTGPVNLHPFGLWAVANDPDCRGAIDVREVDARAELV